MAAGIFKKLQLKHIAIPGIDHGICGNPVEDIVQELLAFLVGEPLLVKNLQDKNPGSLIKINRYFFNHIIDRNRGKENNQDIYKNRWRLFYRHAREVLDRSDRFIKYLTPCNPVCFSIKDSDPKLVVLPEDLPDVPFPADVTADFSQVNKKRSILRLASHYWEMCARETHEPAIRISVKAFTGWVDRYVGLSTRIESVAHAFSREKSTTNEPVPESRITEEKNEIMKQKYLSTWADNFSQVLSQNEKMLFYYFECLGIKGAEISEKMGKKSNLNYHKNKIRDKLTGFLMPLEWISPDLSRNSDRREPKDFLFFMKELCKKLGKVIDPAI